MSDHSVSIVPKQSHVVNNKQKASDVLKWLISRDIVKSEVTDCTLGDPGYSVSTGVVRIVESPGDLPYDLITNGLEVVVERQVFDTMENFVEVLLCPKCQEDIAFEDWDVEAWATGSDENMSCPLCHSASDIHSYQFEPAWGFSDLGFTFWNWPEFTNEFLEEFKEKLGCDITVVNRLT